MQANRIIPAALGIGLMTFATSALAQVSEGYGHHPYMWGGGGGHFFYPIIGIIVVLLIIGFMARMMGCGMHRCGHRRSSSDALTILEERFAKGEIDKAEFEERKKTLRP